jgi:hypothetical protein
MRSEYTGRCLICGALGECECTEETEAAIPSPAPVLLAVAAGARQIMASRRKGW